MKPPPRRGILWDPAYRIIATRFPAVDLWEGVDPALWERLDQVEALTNPRLAVDSEAVSYIRWPFDNPRPGRFSTAVHGAFYAAKVMGGAIAETVHHSAIRCREDRLDPHDFDMRVLSVEVEGRFHDITGKRAESYPGVMDPVGYGASQALAESLLRLGSQGILYSSVRDASGSPCVAAFDPSAIKRCAHLRYLTYRWDGKNVLPLYEKLPISPASCI